jgi:hypothetical protein
LVQRGFQIREVLYVQQIYRAGLENNIQFGDGSDFRGFGLERCHCNTVGDK